MNSESKSALSHERARQQARQILVVEDDEDSAKVMACFLDAQGYAVQIARNGTEALVVARSFHPLVVLVDIGLPGLDGLHVARELKKTNDQALLIAITGRSEREDRIRSKQAGFDHHFVKPVDFLAIRALIGDEISRRDHGVENKK